MNRRRGYRGLYRRKDKVNETFDELEPSTSRNQDQRYRQPAAFDREVDDKSEKRLSSMFSREREKSSDFSEQVQIALKMAMKRSKELAANAFRENVIIDHLTEVVANKSLLQAGALVDASAVIYSLRVDEAHTQAFNVRSKLGDASTNDDEIYEGPALDRAGKDMSEGASTDEDNTVEGTSNYSKNKKQRGKCDDARGYDGSSEDDTSNIANIEIQPFNLLSESDAPGLSENWLQQLDGDVDTLKLEQKFIEKSEDVERKKESRRKKLSMVSTVSFDLNDTSSKVEFSGHLYCKASHNFNEGSTAGLLLQNSVSNHSGTRIMLHESFPCRNSHLNERIAIGVLHSLYCLIEDCERENNHDCADVFGENGYLNATSISKTKTDLLDPAESDSRTAKFRTSLSSLSSVESRARYLLDKCGSSGNSRNVFDQRRHLQRKLDIGTPEFIREVIKTLRNEDPQVRASIIGKLLDPRQISNDWTSIPGESGVASAEIAEEIENFDRSLTWVIKKLRWEDMSDQKRAKELRSDSENQVYNYFFARSSKPCFGELEGSAEPVSFWKSESVITEYPDRATEDAYRELARIVTNFHIPKSGCLFARKGDDLDRSLATIAIATRRRPKVSDIIIDRSSAVDVMPTVSEVDDIPDLETEVVNEDYGRQCSEPAVDVSDSNSLAVLEGPSRADNDELDRCKAMSNEVIDPTTAEGDLQFFDENRILNSVNAIIGDDSHWKKRMREQQKAVDALRRKELHKEKKEKLKAKKDAVCAEDWNWSESDDFPLDDIRERMRKAKKPSQFTLDRGTVLSENMRRPACHLYMPHMFCRLGHVFTGEWGNLRVNRAASVPRDENSETRRWLDSVVRNLPIEEKDIAERIEDWMNMFSGLIESVGDRTMRSGSEQYVPNVDDFEDAADNFGDSSSDANKPSTSRVNSDHSVLSSADSDREEAEILGVRYPVRQGRINAAAVKRAMATILSQKALDADALNAEVRIARLRISGEKDKIGYICKNADLSSGSSYNNMSAEEAELQFEEENRMTDDPMREIHLQDSHVGGVIVIGRHTFTSLMFRLPDYLTGRTANDLTCTNALPILLQLCNENNIELIQHRGEDGLVRVDDMDDLTIKLREA